MERRFIPIEVTRAMALTGLDELLEEPLPVSPGWQPSSAQRRPQ